MFFSLRKANNFKYFYLMVNKHMLKTKGGADEISIPILGRVMNIIFGELEGGEHKPNILNQLLVAMFYKKHQPY